MKKLNIATPKQLITTLPRYIFRGRIIVIQSESEAVRAINYLRKYAILGLDTETRPSFRKGQRRKIALIQLAQDNLCFLFRISHMGLPICLINLLEDTTITKVGLSLKDDFLQIRQFYPNFTPSGIVDLQHMATQMGIQDLSLAKLFANFFKQRISKSAQLSNWEADILDNKQKEYAATDAEACLKLYRQMVQLQASGNYELVPLPSSELSSSDKYSYHQRSHNNTKTNT